MSKRTAWQRVAWWALALALTAGCFRFVPPDALTPQSGSLVQYVTPEPAVAPSPLLTALAMLPFDTEADGPRSVAFTDWTLIKAYEGAEHITSQTDETAKFDFLIGLNQTQATFSAYGISRLRGHLETWGWDTTDTAWEAHTFIGSPLYVLKFRTGFDFGPIVQRFEERGFTRTDHRGVPIYSHRMDMTQDWLRATEFAILNTAVLADEGILILSINLETVQAALDAYYGDDVLSFADFAPLQETARQMGETATAYLDVAGCGALGAVRALLANPADGETYERLKDLLTGENALTLHPYVTLGVGYRYEGGAPVGLILLHYTDAALAQADLPARLAIAQQGESLRTRQPFRETVVDVTEGVVEGTTLILRGRPAGDRPDRLLHMVAARDMVFAAC